jgi:hypothetical protein
MIPIFMIKLNYIIFHIINSINVSVCVVSGVCGIKLTSRRRSLQLIVKILVSK